MKIYLNISINTLHDISAVTKIKTEKSNPDTLSDYKKKFKTATHK